MRSWIQPPHRDLGEGVPPSDRLRALGLELSGGELEDLRPARPPGAGMVYDVVDGRPDGRGRLERERDVDGIADREHFGQRVQGAHGDARRVAVTQQLQCPRVATLDQGPQASTHHPRRALAVTSGPPRRNGQGDVGVVAADVVEVIRDRPPDVLALVVEQQLQQRQRRRRIEDEVTQHRRPGQARPGALRDEPSHVLVRIGRPAVQVAPRDVGVPEQEGADRPLAREPRRQRSEHGQREVRLVDAVGGDVVAARQRHPARERG